VQAPQNEYFVTRWGNMVVTIMSFFHLNFKNCADENDLPNTFDEQSIENNA